MSPTPHLAGYPECRSHIDRMRCVGAESSLTWLDVAAVRASYDDRGLPVPMRHLLAERLDVISGTYTSASLQRAQHLLGPGHDEASLWATLLRRATPAGRQRLLTIFGDSFGRPPGLGDLWSPEAWSLVASLFPPPAGLPDWVMARTLSQVFDAGAHHADDTAGPGDLWVTVWLTCPILPPGGMLRPAFERQAPWFLAAPHRLSDAAVTRLLTEGAPFLRHWAITHALPHHTPSIAAPIAEARRPEALVPAGPDADARPPASRATR